MMILRLSYEEVVALNSAAERILGEEGEVRVLAPPEPMAGLVGRLPLAGDLSVSTLSDQRQLIRAVEVVLDDLRYRMDSFVLDQHAGSEDSVSAFFDYSNVLTAWAKLAEMGAEMEALLRVMSGGGSTPEPDTTFPD